MKTRFAIGALAFATLLPCASFAQAPQGQPPPGMAMPEDMSVMFGRLKAATNIPDMPGTGAFPAKYDMATGKEYVVYEPKDLAKASAARKLAVYAWANGGCAYDGASMRFHLLDIASHGYIAIVPGLIKTGPRGSLGPNAVDPPPAPGTTAKNQTPDLLRGAIDWILAENKRAGSAYFGKIDESKIAMAGGSCGGMIALNVARDARIKSVTLHNSGVFKNMPPQMQGIIAKQDLAKLHTPVLYITGGPSDVAQPNALDDFKTITHVPVFVADRPGAGHLGMSYEPNGEGTKIEIHWLEWQLFGDKKAALMFTGKDCSLCRDITWQVHQKGM